MIAINNPCIASSDALANLSFILPSQRSLVLPLDRTSKCHSYEIEFTLNSESATILFLRSKNTVEHIVIKILCKYKDTRYNLETIAERQRSQLEALQWNRTFTPDIYIGLARICEFDPHQKSICINEIITEPNREMLDQYAEYGLLIHELPQDRGLDYLLEKEKENDDALRRYVELLARRIAHMHEYLNPTISSTFTEDGIQWGSIEQLWKKLTHNLTFADPLLKKIRSEDYSFCYSCLNLVKDTLVKVLMHHRFQSYFEQRVRKQYIKRCHADLKASNIWIAPNELWLTEEPDKSVWILDAIDFNDLYSHIDILSDFATLVVDIQARTKSPSIADHLIDVYLNCSKQQGSIASSVLSYYLVEKAFIGAVLSIVYDNLPDLGLSFLDVAQMRLKSLVDIEQGLSSVSNPASFINLEEPQPIG